MSLGAREIQEILPHRWPFLLVDRIETLEAGQGAVGIKNVSAGDIYFQGHFPGHPIMPGVLIVEALAQVGAVALLSLPQNRGKIGLFTGIDGFRFRRPVKPGDVLRLEVRLTHLRDNYGKAKATASVDGERVAEGELSFAVAEADQLP